MPPNSPVICIFGPVLTPTVPLNNAPGPAPIVAPTEGHDERLLRRGDLRERRARASQRRGDPDTHPNTLHMDNSRNVWDARKARVRAAGLARA